MSTESGQPRPGLRWVRGSQGEARAVSASAREAAPGSMSKWAAAEQEGGWREGHGAHVPREALWWGLRVGTLRGTGGGSPAGT